MIAPRETDSVLLRMLLIQRQYGLDDDAAVEEVADRISLRRFCGLGLEEAVPDAGTLRSFRLGLAGSPQGRALLDEAAARYPLDRGTAQPEPLLSIVSPVYRAEEIVAELVRRITEEVSPITQDFEIILVDDGSPDRAWSRIEEACAADPRVKGIQLSRNFGQHYAITAGLDHARGRWVVVMDCDLQDDPKYIRDLFEKAREGYDIVYTVKARREHGMIHNLGARLFTLALNWFSSGGVVSSRVGGYSMLSRQAVDAFRSVRDVHRHYLVVLRWLGFRSTAIDVQHHKRYRGTSSYTFAKLLRHAVDGVASHSDRLLYLALGAGFLFLSASIAAVLYLVIQYFLHGFKEGWTSTIVLILLSTSMILLSIGAAGIYIGKIFDQVKQRPLYLTRRKLNL
ncbi:MAG TPA: glycosyltransferase [Thermoanaerobaculia bacterium]|nr:glycosyltransferase [Thermoanaerobaculia bacterium]